MSDSTLTGRAFSREIVWVATRFSMPALAVIIAVVAVLLQLTFDQWVTLIAAMSVYTVFASIIQVALQKRCMAPITTYLDARIAQEVTPEIREAAFVRAIDLPRVLAGVAIAGWLVPVIVMNLVMDTMWTYWGVYEWISVMLAGFSAGMIASIFNMFRVKQIVAPIRNRLGEELGDPERRAELVPALPLASKLLVTITSIAVVPVVFAVLLFQSEAARSVESFAVQWERGLIAVAGEQAGDGNAMAVVMQDAPNLARGVTIAAVDPAAREAAGIEDFLLAAIRRKVEKGAESGDSLSLPGDRYFAWRVHGDHLLVASMPRDTVALNVTRMWVVFGIVLVLSIAASLWLARLVANDVVRAIDWLGEQASRLASGDLRPGRVYESEDELGGLARSFEVMATSLRGTVGGLAQTADRVEATSVEMAQVAQSVAGVTTDQVQGIERTSSLMEQINAQVRGIAESAQALNVSVEESSSSILELGAAGEELNETASVLGERVNEVSSSIEQMVRSVKQVSENTEGLSEAAMETSASMGEMATSMREVDASAEETARLSSQMVDAAESGQAKMVQTIGGMDAIREATETAEQVIRSLGGRASEIGAIVDVIDDVADETNLLALNAAIIAAQAGENGRAFSVVADEIKDLADRVFASTKEIGSLIRAVQDESENAIGAIEQGTESVASGVDLAAAAGTSLEEITRASRESGQRIAGIVSAVREQARAAGHVVDLMERVRSGVEEIRSAAAEQDRGNEVVYRGAVAMRDVAHQVRGTTEEQARGSGRIRESVESVREAVEQINSALQEQTAACRSALEFLEAMHGRTETNEEAAKRLDRVAEDLVHQAEQLRRDVERFQLA